MFGSLYLVEMGVEREQAASEKSLSISDLLYFPLFFVLGMVALQNECYSDFFS